MFLVFNTTKSAFFTKIAKISSDKVNFDITTLSPNILPILKIKVKTASMQNFSFGAHISNYLEGGSEYAPLLIWLKPKLVEAILIDYVIINLVWLILNICKRNY